MSALHSVKFKKTGLLEPCPGPSRQDSCRMRFIWHLGIPNSHNPKADIELVVESLQYGSPFYHYYCRAGLFPLLPFVATA